MISTYEKHLRRRCNNTKLYRSDAKLSAWLGIPETQVQHVLDELVAADVLRPGGVSKSGKEIYWLRPAVDALTDLGDPLEWDK